MTLAVQVGSEFQKTGTHHLITVAVCCALMLVLCLLGRAWNGRAREVRLRRAWVVVMVAWHLGSLLLALLPTNFTPLRSLPLHLCDLALIPVSLALWCEWGRARTLSYYWGLGLSTQAFLTPILTKGPDTLVFWAFWGNHTTLVGAACYVVWVRGYRPTWRAARFAFGATVGYAALVLPIDLIFDWNYGFLGRENLPGTVIELLPPWPLRILALLGLVGGWFLLISWIWRLPFRNRAGLRNVPPDG